MLLKRLQKKFAVSVEGPCDESTIGGILKYKLNCLKLVLRESPVDANSWKVYNKGKKAARRMMGKDERFYV